MTNKKILHWGLIHILRSFLLKPLYMLNLMYPKPTQVCITTTLACNSRCKQCNLWKMDRKGKKELSTEECKRIIFKLKQWLGSYCLFFVGGESTLRKDLPELIAFASKLNLPTALMTNLLLDDKEQLLDIINSGLEFIHISLDGINPKTHDYARGREGSFDKVMENIEFIKKSNNHVNIRIVTVISKNNLDEIGELIEWVENDKRLYDITFQPILPSVDTYKKWAPNWKNKSPLWPKDTKKIDKGMNTIILMKKKGYKISNSVRQLRYMKMYLLNINEKLNEIECASYENGLVIATNGGILLCKSMDPIGSILTEDIKYLWNHKSKETIKKIKKCKKPCILINCHFGYKSNSKIEKFFRILKN